ncbi:MAG: sigma-70 family RNA polymerase sigma factor [Deltaproteobacteria bacterium]|nr:sigma-70 family RNA polymerase sigma factor [Deltaproteobacteria bacterium]
MRRLLESVSPQVLRVVRGVLGRSHPEVEDVAQDAMVLVVRALPSYRQEATVAAYVSRIAVRAAITARTRCRTRESRTQEQEIEHFESADLVPQDADSLAARRRQLLRGVLREIPEAQAEALVMRAVLGFSLEETAEAAGCPPNTIRSRLRLAREALQKRIESDPILADHLEIEP